MHAVNAASMNAKMALAAVDNDDMGTNWDDCQDCLDESDEMQTCDNVCVSPILAVGPSGQSGLPVIRTAPENPALQSVFGRTGLPDPYPPRSIILS